MRISVGIVSLGFAVLFSLSGCQTVAETPNTEISLEQHWANLYAAAIADAQTIENNEIYSGLTAIVTSNMSLSWQMVSGNAHVLMVCVTRYPNSYPTGNTIQMSWGKTWVTAYPDLKNRLLALAPPTENQQVRLKQLLGLPVGNTYTHVVEFWVNPADLIRPAYDNEITDTTVGISFPNTASIDYQNWFTGNVNYTENGYPWTRLGYTYDWANPNSPDEIGVSEFVITRNAVAVVKSNARIADYFR